MMPLQTPYHDVIDRLSNLVSRDPLNGNTTLVLDAGGPGYPVLDFLRKARPDVVEREKTRLATLEETLDKLKRAQESLKVSP